MTKLDIAHKKLSSIVDEVNAHIKDVQSEEDTKIKIILRVLVECLGWSTTQIGSERKHQNGFSDFIISESENQSFILEAKRIGSLTLPTAETNKVRHLKLSGPVMQNVQDGIDQVVGYAAPNGITVAVLTDGTSWIVFKTFIPGSNFKSHEAFVFPSLSAVLNDFSIFYELLSRECFARKIYSVHFDKLHNNRLLLSQVLKSPFSENEIKIKQKTDLAFDLDNVFATFFSRLTGDQDEDLLVECFVETRESRIADFALEKITASVLGNISSPEKDVDVELKALIQNTVNNEEVEDIEVGQTVFIVGPTGAGKTTFLERFFSKTLSGDLRNQCIVVQVNCLDSSGREDTVLQWFTETLIKSLERQVYKQGVPTWEELRGLYYAEYERRRIGVDAQLYEKDKDAFIKNFSTYLDQKVESDREGYLRRILKDVVRNRKKLPIILIDNTDEFSPDFKKEIFQFAQSLRREVNHCILLFPVTDKSAWSFSKTDLYGIYKSKSFFLPTPPPREVFRRRIDFIRKKIKTLISPTEKRKYLAGKNIRLSIENLEGFASVVEETFVNDDYASTTIGEITNYNIRKTLELSQRVITSSVYEIEDILKAYIAGNMGAIQNHAKFMNALLKGDYELYKHNDNHFVLSLFQVDNEIRQSPLLLLRILGLLNASKNAARNVEDKHLTVKSIFDYFDSMGVAEIAVDKALLRLLEANLIEAYDSSMRDLTVGQRVAITFSGARHLNLALYNQVFLEQMALTTAITNHDTAQIIRGCYLADEKYQDKMKAIRTVFLDYLFQEDSAHMATPESGEQYDNQRQLLEKLDKSSQSKQQSALDGASSSADQIIAQGIIATVDWFDAEKGFGFVDAEGIQRQIFVHAEQLKKKGIERLFDGDQILCDVLQNNKGFYVSHIHDLETNKKKFENVACEVIRIFPDRGYGFVRIGDGTRDAFFHVSVFEDSSRISLKQGFKFNAEISPDKSGEGFLVRKVL